MSYEIIPVQSRRLEDEKMIEILTVLKELQIRRTLIHEPIHLEAAIDYCALRSSLEPPDKQDECQLRLLKRAKEEFSTNEGLWSKDYHSNRALHPEKDYIYQAYMTLINAHIARLEANAAKKENRIEEHRIRSEDAIASYRLLLHGEFATFKYLSEQAESGLAKLEK